MSSINCSYRTYKYSYVTMGPLLVGLRVSVISSPTSCSTPTPPKIEYSASWWTITLGRISTGHYREEGCYTSSAGRNH